MRRAARRSPARCRGQARLRQRRQEGLRFFLSRAPSGSPICFQVRHQSVSARAPVRRNHFNLSLPGLTGRSSNHRPQLPYKNGDYWMPAFAGMTEIRVPAQPRASRCRGGRSRPASRSCRPPHRRAACASRMSRPRARDAEHAAAIGEDAVAVALGAGMEDLHARHRARRHRGP